MSMVRFTPLSFSFFLLFLPGFSQIPYLKSDSLITEGVALHEKEEFNAALELFDQIHEGDTLYLLAQAEKANSLTSLERYDEAIVLAEGLLKKRSPYRAMLYSCLGTAYDKSGNLDSAISVFTRGLKKYPNDYLLHYNLGTTLKNHDRPKEAMDHFQQALKINPYHSNSHLSLAIMAAEMGLPTKTQLAMATYLAIVPRNNQALVALNDMFMGKWDLFNTKKNIIDNSEFEEIDLVVNSKAAMDEKFNSVIKFRAPVAQQSEMIMELLKHNPDSKDFWMQFYVPFYTRLQSEGLNQAFVYHILQSADSKEIAKWRKSNSKDTDRFIEVANDALNTLRSVRTAEVCGVMDTYNCWFYDNKHFNAIGKENEAGENIGPYEFYHSNQEPQAFGIYNDEGAKIGKWVYYYEDGTVSKEEIYDQQGVVSEPVLFYGENGKLRTIIPYENDQPHGTVKTHYPSGLPKEDIPAVKGVKDGKGTGYYLSGAKNFEYTYDEGELTGDFIYYFATGELSQTLTYKDSKLNGPFRDYFIDGTVYREGDYVNDLAQGVWIYRFNNGQVSSEGEYSEGLKTGLWKYYFRSGAVYSEEKFDDEGNLIYEVIYDEDGKKHYEHELEKGKLLKYTFYDKEGNIISEGSDKNGNMAYKGLYPNGATWITGTFKKGDKEGLFTYYRRSGSIESEANYSGDEYNGIYKSYHESGKLHTEVNYKDGVKSGYYKEYYSDGSLEKEGWVINDLSQQQWKEYHRNGEISREYFLIDDYFNGPVRYYDPLGRITSAEYYNEGLLTRVEQYDTLGKVFNAFDLDFGTGEHVMKYANGKPERTTALRGGDNVKDIIHYTPSGQRTVSYPVRHGVITGQFTDYHPNGKTDIKGEYYNGNRHGTWTFFDKDGRLTRENQYYHGELDGLVKSFYPNGKPELIREYSNGEPVGSSQYFAPDGTLQIEKFYDIHGITGYRYLKEDGQLCETIPVDLTSDEIRAYYPNGKVSAVQHYKHGVFDKEIILYYPGGQVMSRQTFEQGQENGLREEFYEDGTPKFRGMYVGDVLDGEVVTYYPNGKKQKVSHYIQGIQQGTEIHYDKNGKETERRTYVNNQWY